MGNNEMGQNMTHNMTNNKMSSAMRTVLMGSGTMTISSAILSGINIVLHTTGAYLLLCLYRSGSRTVQTIFLINLSIFEVIISLISLAEDSLDFVDNQSLYKKLTKSSISSFIPLTCCISGIFS